MYWIMKKKNGGEESQLHNQQYNLQKKNTTLDY